MADPERDPDAPRRVGLRAFNKTKSFFNEHDMIFEKIDLESDIGIDAILTFARRGPDAGRFVNVQVKGGKTYKRATHIDEFYGRYRGMASLRSTDWRLWKDIEPPRGYEGHHIVDVDARLKTVWHNARPTYVIVQDPDDDELYFGNLTRMVDMQPLDQDLADVYERMHKPNDGSVFHRYLAAVHERISRLNDEERSQHKTWMPLYPDLRLTPDGLDRFLEYALADARQPLPERQFPGGEIETIVTYPDSTIGPSLEALEARKRLDLKLRRNGVAILCVCARPRAITHSEATDRHKAQIIEQIAEYFRGQVGEPECFGERILPGSVRPSPRVPASPSDPVRASLSDMAVDGVRLIREFPRRTRHEGSGRTAPSHYAVSSLVPSARSAAAMIGR